MYENSFIAAPPQHSFVKQWLTTLLHFTKYRDLYDAFVKDLPQQKALDPNYHIPYYCLIHMQVNEYAGYAAARTYRMSTNYFVSWETLKRKLKSRQLRRGIYKLCRQARNNMDAFLN